MPKIRAVSSRGGVSFFSSSATSDDEGDDGAFVSNVTIDTDDDSIFANSDTNTNDTSGPNLHGRIYVALNDGLDDVTSLEIIDLRGEFIYNFVIRHDRLWSVLAFVHNDSHRVDMVLIECEHAYMYTVLS